MPPSPADSHDWSYETGNDSTIGYGVGSKTRQIAYTGGTPTSTFTTTFSATDTENDTYTESQSDVATLDHRRPDRLRLRHHVAHRLRHRLLHLAEAGEAVVRATNDIAGSYTDTVTTALRLAVRQHLAGTRHRRHHRRRHRLLHRHRQLFRQPDRPQERLRRLLRLGRHFYATYSQLSINTDSLFSVNNSSQTLGAGGWSSGGDNTFTFDQANSDSHYLLPAPSLSPSPTSARIHTWAWPARDRWTERDGLRRLRLLHLGGRYSASDYYELIQSPGILNDVGTIYQLTVYTSSSTASMTAAPTCWAPATRSWAAVTPTPGARRATWPPR